MKCNLSQNVEILETEQVGLEHDERIVELDFDESRENVFCIFGLVGDL